MRPHFCLERNACGRRHSRNLQSSSSVQSRFSENSITSGVSLKVGKSEFRSSKIFLCVLCEYCQSRLCLIRCSHDATVCNINTALPEGWSDIDYNHAITSTWRTADFCGVLSRCARMPRYVVVATELSALFIVYTFQSVVDGKSRVSEHKYSIELLF